jgi:hypothetical protein
LQNPWPVFLDPAVDRRLITLGGPAPGTLERPAEPVAQQRPHVRRMMLNPGEAFDHHRDAVQGPQFPDEPIRRRPVEQRLLDRRQLGI